MIQKSRKKDNQIKRQRKRDNKKMKQIYNALQRKEKKEKNYEKNIVDHHDMKSESAQNSSSVLP